MFLENAPPKSIPVGFPSWPCKRVHLMKHVIMKNAQNQINQLQGASAHQHGNPESESEDIETINNDIAEREQASYGVTESDSD